MTGGKGTGENDPTGHINKLSNPEVVGPGTWWVLHMKAKAATDDKGIKDFIAFMLFLRENFSCMKCRKHIGEYIDTHPFSDLINYRNSEGERQGMFKWSWLFHNAVNARLGKPHVDWETAVDMFYGDSAVCNTVCGSEESHGESPEIYFSEEESDDTSDNGTEVSRSYEEEVHSFPTTNTDRKSKLAQGYFMSVGIPNTLEKNRVYSPPEDSWTVTYTTVN